jgi:hypothetical protein
MPPKKGLASLGDYKGAGGGAGGGGGAGDDAGNNRYVGSGQVRSLFAAPRARARPSLARSLARSLTYPPPRRTWFRTSRRPTGC